MSLMERQERSRQEVHQELDFLRRMGSKIFLYPFIGKAQRQILGSIVLNLLVVCTSTQLFLTIVLTKSADWLEIINVAPNLGVCVMTVIKYTKFESHKELYEEIFLHFRDGMWDNLSHSESHSKIVSKYRKIAMYINRFLLYYAIPLTVVVDSFPYLVMKYGEKVMGTKEYLYPFDGWYPFDKIKFYWIAYAWESCMTAVVVCVYGFTNMAHATYVAFACMELRILGDCLENLLTPEDVVNIKNGLNTDETHSRILRSLKIIIAKHEFLAKKFAALDAILGDAMLLNYSLGAVFICLTAFTFTVVNNFYKRLRYLFMCVSLLLEIFCQCLLGQVLSDHSENLTDCIYSSAWTRASPETKKIMLMLMLRTQKPFQFTGNGYVSMNMHTFSNICTNSYQCFNLLHTVYV